MLRLRPTKIAIEARDLKWHKGRFDRRQIKRAKEARLGAEAGESEAQRVNPPIKSPRNTSTHTGVPNIDDDESIVSPKPVPQGSDRFWEEMLNRAITPKSTKDAPMTSKDTLEGGTIMKQKSRPTRTSSMDTESDSYTLSDFATEDNVQETSDERLSLSSASFDSRGARQESERVKTKRPPNKLTKKSLFPPFRNRKPWNFDGPSDIDPGSPEPARNTPDDPFEDGLYGDRNDRRTISGSWQAFASEQADASAHERSPTTPAPDHQPSLPSLTSSGLLSQPPRRRNMRYRPRSQSYSYVDSAESQGLALDQYDGPAASPADMEDRAPLDEDDNATQIRSSPPQQARHGMPSMRTPSNQSISNAHQAVRISSYHSLRSHRMSSYHSLRSTGSLGSQISFQSHRTPPFLSPTQRTSPYNTISAPPPTPTHTHANHPRLPIPAPFSSTPRSTSLSLNPTRTLSPNALPFHPSTPTSSHHSSTHSLPIHQPRQPHTPPSTSTINIYNDSLPALSQPQTPADLESPLRLSGRNPFGTAPARYRHGHGSAWGTPTRRPLPSFRRTGQGSWGRRRSGMGGGDAADGGPRGREGDVGIGEVGRGREGRVDGAGGIRGTNSEIENAGRVTEEERAWRRRRDAGVGIGVEELERVGRGL